MARLFHVVNSRLCIWAAILAVLAGLPVVVNENITMILVQVFLYMAIGQMWNLLAGYAGLVSLGQQMFIGLGGYALAVVTEIYHLPILGGILLGGVISVIFALIISLPIFKMRGVYFSIGSWIAAEALAVFFSNWTYVRSGQGFNITASYDLTTINLYYIALCVALGAGVLIYALLRSELGLALMAMRDNESAAETIGIGLYKTKLKCFLISAFITGITGGALYLSTAYIQPYAAFGIDWTVAMVFMVIIGGIGTIEGPILGAFFYVLLKQYLYDYPGFSMIILGVTAIAIIFLAPRGIMGTIYERYGFEVLSTRRWLKDMVVRR